MNSFQLEELIKNIQAMIKCPSCGKSYKKEDIHFLGQMSQAVLVQLNCNICRMPVMATIVASKDPNKLPSFKDIGEYSEKMPRDLKSLKHRNDKSNPEKPISSDEVLDFHDFLEDFDGNFEKEFRS